MRRPFIAGNWKMNNLAADTASLINAVRPSVADVTGVDIAVCPPFTSLAAAAHALAGSNIMLGAQNCHWEPSGAYTGEVSPQMLIDAGCKVVTVGHSERRQYFAETNETVSKRLAAALGAGLHVIVCCGELLSEREAGNKEQVVESHIRGGLGDLSPEQMSSVTIAYEPVWAIGTGVTATPEQAQEMHKFIRGLVGEMFGSGVADNTRIQYGGSVKPDNVDELMACPDVDGALVGGASLKAESFARIVKFQAK